MVYHSSFVDEEGVTKACGCSLLPLKSHIKGPAPVSEQDRTDIADEAITFFRANVFFINFDIQSSADKLLIQRLDFLFLAFLLILNPGRKQLSDSWRGFKVGFVLDYCKFVKRKVLDSEGILSWEFCARRHEELFHEGLLHLG